MPEIQQLFNDLWLDYSTMNPIANQIHTLLTQKGEIVENDHVALRTFNFPSIGVEKLSQPFKNLGYVEKGEYSFEEKKLFAKHYEHPDTLQPKVFISELLVDKFSPNVQSLVKQLVEQVSESVVTSPNFPIAGVPWKAISSSEYEVLRVESEYAAWMAVNGFRANHFTVNVNRLKNFKTLQSLNEFLKANGFLLNSKGGEIKGSPEQLLEQSSTLANRVLFDLSDGQFELPGCYYEFALRYPMANGQLYTGFIAASADKIFESTNKNLQ